MEIVKKKDNKDTGAIEIIEEAVQVLRRHPVNLLSGYYIGSLPFVGALLFFWADMSRSAFAPDYCSPASLGLAFLFIWMKCWHAVFCQKIMASMNRQPAQPWSTKRIGRLMATQTILQSTGLFILPIALIIVIPFGWIYAFYQNLLSQNNGNTTGLKEVYNRSWRLAQLWPGQNHLLILIILFFALFAFFNIGITIFLIPIFLNKLLGITTVFSLSGPNIFNTTFLAATCALTYLCVDPLIKAVYTLRCFYGSSLETGNDIRADLKGFTGYRRGLSYIILLWLCATPFFNAMASDTSGAPYVINTQREQTIDPQELDQSIEDIMSRTEFAWRMPRERLNTAEEESGLVSRLMDWLITKIRNLVKWISKWWNKFIDWFRSLFPDIKPGPFNINRGWVKAAPIFLYAILITLLCLLAIILWRLFQRRRRLPIKAVSEPVVSMPDLTEDYIDPLERPADQWLTMATALIQKRSFRLALRAFYLSALARLAENELITIAKYKSNMDYEKELERRARDQNDLLVLFSMNVQTFDRSWYGMHEVTQKDLNAFIENQERMMSIVQGQ